MSAFARFAVMACIVSLGIALRFYGLGAKSLWYNEADSSCFLDYSAGEIVQRSAGPRAVHPPLYFVALRLWGAVWGLSDASLRALSAVCGVVMIGGSYFFVAELVRLPRPKVASPALPPLLTAFLVATSPLQIHLSQQVRGYSFGTAWFVISSCALLRALRGGASRGPWWLVFAVVTLAFCYTHHIALFSVMAQAVYTLAYLAVRRGDTNPPDGAAGWVIVPQGCWILVAAAIVVCGYVVPWFPRLVAQGASLSRDYVEPISLRSIPEETFRALCLTGHEAPQRFLVEALPVAVMVLATMLCLLFQGGWPGRYLAATGLLPLALMSAWSFQSHKTLIEARYLSFQQIPWLAGIATLVGMVPLRPGRWLLSLWLCCVSVMLCAASWPVIGRSAEPGMRSAVSFVLAHRARGELVVSTNPYDFCGLRHYMRGHSRPMLCVADARRGPLHGSEHLDDGLLIPVQALKRFHGRGLWLLTSHSYDSSKQTDLELPTSWQCDIWQSFRRDYYLEDPIMVRHFSTGGR